MRNESYKLNLEKIVENKKAKSLVREQIEDKKMLKEFIESYATKNTYGQKQQFLQETLDGLNNLDGSLLAKQLQSQFNQLINIFKIHPKVSIEFLFTKISLEDCIKLMTLTSEQQFTKQGFGVIRAIKEISEEISNTEKDRDYLEWFSKMYTKYSSYEKILVFLKFLSSTYHNKFSDDFLPQFLADFIKGSAIAIEAYLKLKAQSPKFDVEYLEHGELIVNSTQKWIKNCYIELLKNLRIPKESSPLKRSILNAVCDIIGALMEVQRQGNIQNQICQQILNESYSYVKKITNLEEFNTLYLNLLREKKFNIVHHKIIIPEKYLSNPITFPKQSFAYIVFRFLDQSYGIYSNEQMIKYLIPVINQFSQFDYEVKSEVQKMFTKFIQPDTQVFEPLLSRSFPLSILWFNLTHYKNNHNSVYLDQIQNIFQKLSQKSPSTYINCLKILNEFQTESFQNEKIQMIGERILLLQNFDSKELKILLKGIDWSQLNQKGEKVWNEVIKKISENENVKTFLSSLLVSKQIKTDFKKQLLEIVTK